MSPTIIYPDIRLRHKFFVLTLLITALCIVPLLFIALAVSIGGNDPTGAAVMLIMALVGLACAVPVLLVIPPYFRSLRYEIHNDEVIVHAGVITKSVKHVPFRTVTNLEVKRGPLDRLYGIGGLKIQTAGFSGQTGAEENLLGMSDVQGVYEQVAAAVRRYRQTAMDPTQAGAELKLGDERQLLADILTEMRQLRQALTTNDKPGA